MESFIWENWANGICSPSIFLDLEFKSWFVSPTLVLKVSINEMIIVRVAFGFCEACSKELEPVSSQSIYPTSTDRQRRILLAPWLITLDKKAKHRVAGNNFTMSVCSHFRKHKNYIIRVFSKCLQILFFVQNWKGSQRFFPVAWETFCH